jgi:hypothetical protein
MWYKEKSQFVAVYYTRGISYPQFFLKELCPFELDFFWCAFVLCYKFIDVINLSNSYTCVNDACRFIMCQLSSVVFFELFMVSMNDYEWYNTCMIWGGSHPNQFRLIMNSSKSCLVLKYFDVHVYMYLESYYLYKHYTEVNYDVSSVG